MMNPRDVPDIDVEQLIKACDLPVLADRERSEEIARSVLAAILTRHDPSTPSAHGFRAAGCPRLADGDPHRPHTWQDQKFGVVEMLWCDGGSAGSREPTIGPAGPSGISPASATPPGPAALPPFSGDDPTCPKCGNVGATTRFLNIGTCNHVAELIIGVHPNERLHRECRRCDYAWDEATVTTCTGEET